jgi:hypothetical protein
MTMPIMFTCPTCKAAPFKICEDLSRKPHQPFPMEIHHRERIVIAERFYMAMGN